MLPTTPFGRRPLSAGLLATQTLAASTPDDAVVHKWRILRALTLAKGRLGLSDRALNVLDALLTFHPETALTPGAGLTVFPSNRELALRARGPALKTLQRALAQLMEVGLIIRRDSPNGKRYARRGQGGEIAQAFGFDLTPLIARAAEIEAVAAEVEGELRQIALLRERITLHRRDIAKMIAMAIEAGAPGDWHGFMARHQALSGRLRRTEPMSDLEPLAADLHALHVEVAKCLEGFLKTQNMTRNDRQDGSDIQNSNTEPLESEPCFQRSWGQGLREPSETDHSPPSKAGQGSASSPKPQAYPLGMVIDACPDLVDWAKSGSISGWSEFVATAGTVRSALGISPSAYEDAREVMDEIPAAIVVAAILQKGESVRSPGSYLRGLTEKARAGEFSLGPMLMALLSAKVRSGKRKRA
ncbi:plasmid replication protein RepC [Tabrizicola sp.]|uniref:plasmid replication protein RepC n=1 Tax=Tabrizicola sp. TaxID=2005166 RepID=UPI003F2FE219